MVEIKLDARKIEDYNSLKHLEKLKLNHDVKKINQCNQLQIEKKVCKLMTYNAIVN